MSPAATVRLRHRTTGEWFAGFILRPKTGPARSWVTDATKALTYSPNEFNRLTRVNCGRKLLTKVDVVAVESGGAA